jgi:hypothetical protein
MPRTAKPEEMTMSRKPDQRLKADDEPETAEDTTDPRSQSGALADAEGREDRAMEDRSISENRVYTDEDRLRLFQSQFQQDVLPDLPTIPGYHICWLTTTNLRDTIESRMRLGYEPVTPKDIPGWKHATLKSGTYEGMIGVNEMLAFKLPLELYEKYMQEAHHNGPMRQQAALTANVDNLNENLKRHESRIYEGDGFKQLRENAPRPNVVSDRDRYGST